MSQKGKFWRPFTSLMVTWGFLLLALSGVVLYIVPHGRVAYWTDWHMWGLSKTQWGDIHIAGGLIFIIAGAFHVFFNWGVLLRYLKLKRESQRNTAAIVISLVLTLFVIVGAAKQWPPVSYIASIGGSIKDSWVSAPEHEPPFGHAEEVSLKTLCSKTFIPLDEALAKLESEGIQADPGDKVIDIAQSAGLSPMELYALIEALSQPPKLEKSTLSADEVEAHFAGTGIGRKTLADIAEQSGQSKADIKKRLKSQGIEIDPDMALKQAADKAGIAPLELLKVMLVDDYQPQ